MRKVLTLGALTAAFCAASVPSGYAHPNYHYEGGCELASFRKPGPTLLGASDAWTTAVTASVLATGSTGDPAPLSLISVLCYVYRDGTLLGVPLSAEGLGSAANAALIDPGHGPDHVWTVCEEVTVSGDRHSACHNQSLFVTQTGSGVDSAVCAVLPATEVGYLTITEEGDVYQGQRLVFDCPPYEG